MDIYCQLIIIINPFLTVLSYFIRLALGPTKLLSCPKSVFLCDQVFRTEMERKKTISYISTALQRLKFKLQV